MKAAETSASSAIADWTPLTVVSRSSTTAEIDTFISDVSTTRTNIAIARRRPSRPGPDDSSDTVVVGASVTARRNTPGVAEGRHHPYGVIRSIMAFARRAHRARPDRSPNRPARVGPDREVDARGVPKRLDRISPAEAGSAGR